MFARFPKILYPVIMGYVELHCHSNFSLLDGASPPKALVTRGAALGMHALALPEQTQVLLCAGGLTDFWYNPLWTVSPKVKHREKSVRCEDSGDRKYALSQMSTEPRLRDTIYKSKQT
jgi:hypothetical protein